MGHQNHCTLNSTLVILLQNLNLTKPPANPFKFHSGYITTESLFNEISEGYDFKFHSGYITTHYNHIWDCKQGSLNSTLVILLLLPIVTTITAPTIFKFHSGYITTNC